MKIKISPKITGQLLHSRDGDFRRVIHIINDNSFVTAQQQLKHRMTPNVTGASGDQNALRHVRN